MHARLRNQIISVLKVPLVFSYLIFFLSRYPRFREKYRPRNLRYKVCNSVLRFPFDNKSYVSPAFALRVIYAFTQQPLLDNNWFCLYLDNVVNGWNTVRHMWYRRHRRLCLYEPLSYLCDHFPSDEGRCICFNFQIVGCATDSARFKVGLLSLIFHNGLCCCVLFMIQPSIHIHYTLRRLLNSLSQNAYFWTVK